MTQSFPALCRRDKTLEQAEIDVDSDVAVRHFDSTLDRSAERPHFGDQGEGEVVSLPGALFLQQLDGQIDNSFEQVVERAIDRLFDFGDRTIVRNGDAHEAIAGADCQDTRPEMKREIGKFTESPAK
jgi:hypothetical protein